MFHITEEKEKEEVVGANHGHIGHIGRDPYRGDVGISRSRKKFFCEFSLRIFTRRKQA